MLEMLEKKSVVVIGGGTGIYPVLQGLKKYRDAISIKAVISMADSGGSNARIRDEFGILPVSDINRALAALSTDVQDHDELLRELFLYRFHNGVGLTGHNFGNLLLIALTDMLGSEEAAIKAASKILRIHGRVLPVTTDDINIVAKFEDGVITEGEHEIDEPTDDRIGKKIVDFYTTPKGKITTEVDEAIRGADLVLLGPGDLYSSLLANCVIEGVPEAIQASKGIFVYASNLMTSPGQTDTLTASQHVYEVAKYVGQMPDYVVINTGQVPAHLLERYAEALQFPVVDDSDVLDCKIIKEDLLSDDEIIKKKGDVLRRSLVRGDGDKFAKMLMGLLE